MNSTAGKAYSLGTTLRARAIEILLSSDKSFTVEELQISFPELPPSDIAIELESLLTNKLFKRNKTTLSSFGYAYYFDPKPHMQFFTGIIMQVKELIKQKDRYHHEWTVEDYLAEVAKFDIDALLKLANVGRKPIEMIQKSTFRNYLMYYEEIGFICRIDIAGKDGLYYFNFGFLLIKRKIAESLAFEYIWNLIGKAITLSENQPPELGIHDLKYRSPHPLEVDWEKIQNNPEWKSTKANVYRRVYPTEWGNLVLYVFPNKKAPALHNILIFLKGRSPVKERSKKNRPTISKTWLPTSRYIEFIGHLRQIFFQLQKVDKIFKFKFKVVENFKPYSIGLNYQMLDEKLHDIITKEIPDFLIPKMAELNLENLGITLRFYCYEDYIRGQDVDRYEVHAKAINDVSLESQIRSIVPVLSFQGSAIQDKHTIEKVAKAINDTSRALVQIGDQQRGLFTATNDKLKTIRETTETLDKSIGDLRNIQEDQGESIRGVSDEVQSISLEVTNTGKSIETLQKTLDKTVTTIEEHIDQKVTPLADVQARHDELLESLGQTIGENTKQHTEFIETSRQNLESQTKSNEIFTRFTEESSQVIQTLTKAENKSSDAIQALAGAMKALVDKETLRSMSLFQRLKYKRSQKGKS